MYRLMKLRLWFFMCKSFSLLGKFIGKLIREISGGKGAN